MAIFLRIKSIWEKLCFKPWTVPLGLFALLLLSFGWFIPQLGFYWDDWPVILTAKLRGINSFWRFYEYNRPLSAWIYVLTMPVLGLKPLNWQIFALVLRWLTCVSMWWTLTLVWPRHRRLAAWAALLFAVYPVFIQQPISVAYTQHWTCYLLFFISLGAMLKAQRMKDQPRWFWPLTGVSVAAFLLEILSMEYFSALELLRPLLLWYVVAEKENSITRRLKAIFTGWLPYLAGLAGFLVWRFFFIKLAREDVNAPDLLAQMATSPFASLKRLAEIAIQDSLYLFVRAWTELVNLTGLDLSDRSILITWAAAVLVAVLMFVFLSRLEETRAGRNTHYAGMLVGALAAFMGIFPVWATGRSLMEGMYANRFGLAAMFGASLFLASLIEWLFEDQRKQILVISLLTGMAAGLHLQTANEYRWIWVSQTRFYWQLKWRAPQLEPNTAIFSEGEIFKYVGLYPTSAAINMLYLDHLPGEQLSYWFYSLGRNFAYDMSTFPQGIPAHSTLRNYYFDGSTRDGISIYYNSATNKCLEVLSPADVTAPDLEPLTRTALQVSDLSRISAGPVSVAIPPTDIFGPEPEHGWCYLYQKAGLARQLGDWAQVVALGEEARSQGYHPKASGSNTAMEWLPFIEGYARAGRWQDARELSLSAFEKDQRIDARMCGLWKYFSSFPADGENDPAALAQEIRGQMSCPD